MKVIWIYEDSKIRYPDLYNELISDNQVIFYKALNEK